MESNSFSLTLSLCMCPPCFLSFIKTENLKKKRKKKGKKRPQSMCFCIGDT